MAKNKRMCSIIIRVRGGITMSEADSKQGNFQQKLLLQHHEARIVRRIVLIISLALLLIFSVLVGGGYLYVKSALKPVDPDNKNPIVVKIPIGSSVSTIANILEEKGIIKDALVFKYYVKLKNESGFQAGKYKLSPSMTIPEIVENIKKGKVMKEVVFQITIPEGKQLTQIAKIIAEKTNYKEEDIIAKLNDRQYIQLLMKKYPEILTEEILHKNIRYPLEGYLYPATYPFYEKNPTIEEIIEVMLKQTSKVLAKYQGEMQEKKLTPHKLLTMASLIEEEATEKADREKISSVFYNRLNKGMPLQTDPTVLYALGKHKDRVLYEDLEVNSPYNTYKNKGLPPGPIANAGEVSINAALNPEQTDYLYFLATPAGDVIFTKTLQEHNREKAKYITNK
jgi:UPF0755 protein